MGCWCYGVEWGFSFWGGGVGGQPVIYPEERKGECVLESIPEEKKKGGKGEKRKDKDPFSRQGSVA